MPRGRKIIKTIEIEECTIRIAAEEFFENNHVKGLAQATQRAYKDYVNAFIKWVGEETLLNDISVRTMDKYMLYNEKKGNKAVSIATIMVHLRRFFKFCNSRGYMDKIEITIPKYETELKGRGYIMGMARAAAGLRLCVARTPAKLYFVSSLSSINQIRFIKA